MKADQESQSALTVSVMRAVHSRHDPDPVIDDPYGFDLVSREDLAVIGERVAAQLSRFGLRQVGKGRAGEESLAALLRAHPGYGNVILRTRYAEDCLEEALARGFAQYVVLGAGLDTFGLRRPDLAQSLQIFELDHPASQARKRARLAAAGLAPPANVIWLPVDFERQTVADALGSSDFDTDAPAFFSWLGVSPYLTRQAHVATIRSVARSSTAGCELVFNYLRNGPQTPASDPSGPEPIVSRFDPAEVGAMLAGEGLAVVEDIGPSEIAARYCAGRRDGLRPAGNFRIVHARMRAKLQRGQG